MTRTSRSAKVTTNHDRIRQWTEERGGWPATVKGTGRDSEEVGMIRIDFPGYSGEGSLEKISWDEWFDKFEEKELALLYQDEIDGKTSYFNKLVSRRTAEEREEEYGHP